MSYDGSEPALAGLEVAEVLRTPAGRLGALTVAGRERRGMPPARGPERLPVRRADR
ncbi:hypothetical protein [Actinoallomurus iriomotensis]|nr:hypothetical protein [Actinoallomurus iriomotensis]